ncbi:MAG: hypothetical protein QXP34_03910 [Candidatus Aenigmatarchaeota archaeon]
MKKKGWDEKEKCYYDDEFEEFFIDELEENDADYDEDAYFEKRDQ